MWIFRSWLWSGINLKFSRLNTKTSRNLDSLRRSERLGRLHRTQGSVSFAIIYTNNLHSWKITRFSIWLSLYQYMTHVLILVFFGCNVMLSTDIQIIQTPEEHEFPTSNFRLIDQHKMIILASLIVNCTQQSLGPFSANFWWANRASQAHEAVAKP